MKLKYTYLIVFAISVMIGFFGCVDNPEFDAGTHNAEAPDLGELAVVDNTASFVVLKGAVLSANGYPVSERGFIWDTDSTFPNRNINKLPIGDGIGEFSDTIKQLSAGTAYYFRMYAVNEKGTAYSRMESRVTGDGKGRIKTVVPNDFERASTATVGGIVAMPGEGETLVRGIYYSKSKTLDDKRMIESDTSLDSESFVCELSGLDAETSYYVLAFVTNIVSDDPITSLGDTLMFWTGDGKPRVDSVDVYSIGYDEVTVISRTLSRGDAPLSECGFCLGVNPEPTKLDNYKVCRYQEGSFAEDIKNLIPKQTYYVRAYAQNIFGVYYGKQTVFRLKSDVPIVETLDPSVDYRSGTVFAGGQILDKGKSNIQSRGVCYSTTLQQPTIINSPYVANTEVGDIYSINIPGLKGGTKYYICAYAINDEGISYGNEVKEITTPEILSTPVTFSGSERFTASSAYFMIGNRGYLLGGDRGPAYTNELWSFDANASRDNWQQLQSHSNGPAKWQSVVVDGTSAYVLGGLGSGNVPLDDFRQYSSFGNLWSAPLASGPDAAYSRLGFLLDYSIYYVGGKGTDVKDEVWNYNRLSDTWTQMPDFPAKQYGGAALVVDDIAYVGMGKDESDICNKTLWRSEDASTWIQETTCPSIRGGVLASVVYKGKIYLIDELFYLHEYDLSTKQWKEKSRIQAGQQDIHCMYVIDDLMYIGLIGGSLYIYSPQWDN